MTVHKQPIEVFKIEKKMGRPRKNATIASFEDNWLKFGL